MQENKIKFPFFEVIKGKNEIFQEEIKNFRYLESFPEGRTFHFLSMPEYEIFQKGEEYKKIENALATLQGDGTKFYDLFSEEIIIPKPVFDKVVEPQGVVAVRLSTHNNRDNQFSGSVNSDSLYDIRSNIRKSFQREGFLGKLLPRKVQNIEKSRQYVRSNFASSVSLVHPERGGSIKILFTDNLSINLHSFKEMITAIRTIEKVISATSLDVVFQDIYTDVAIDFDEKEKQILLTPRYLKFKKHTCYCFKVMNHVLVLVTKHWK